LSVLNTSEGFSTYDQMLPLVREGKRHETYWNYSFTPIRDEDSAVVGVFNQGHETTARVLGERRHAFWLALNERLRELATPDQIMSAVAELLGRSMSAARAGYGELDAAVEIICVDGDWANGVSGLTGLTGQSRLLESFGTPIAADLRSGRTLVVHDCVVGPRSAGAEVTKAWASIDLRAIIAVPLIKGGRFVAFLYIHEPHPRGWRDDEVSSWKRSQIETGDAC
jgi:hypothetical protein